jgi:hypothetical protein
MVEEKMAAAAAVPVLDQVQEVVQQVIFVQHLV